MPRNDLAVRNHKLADRSRYDRMSNRFRVHQNKIGPCTFVQPIVLESTCSSA